MDVLDRHLNRFLNSETMLNGIHLACLRQPLELRVSPEVKRCASSVERRVQRSAEPLHLARPASNFSNVRWGVRDTAQASLDRAAINLYWKPDRFAAVQRLSDQRLKVCGEVEDVTELPCPIVSQADIEEVPLLMPDARR
jgi:hypothetical protein